ncbi:MAG: Lrp/AsnC family transcriptional regulator [Pseudomonadota bacterium]
MQNLDATDRHLIAVLKRDGRASITTLAHTLGVSRSTVQTRLDRLIANGTIQRFTVELDAMGRDDRVHAVMMIAVEGPRARSVTRALQRLPEITALHTTNGKWDLIGWIETGTLAEFDRVLRDVREVQGVLNSETCLLLDAAKA